VSPARLFLLPTLLFLGLAFAARAEEPPPTPEEDNWLDVGHAFLERTLLAPALRFDRFFSDERDLEPERARSFLRWRSEVRLTVGDSSPSYSTGVRATLRFPALDRRLRRLRIVLAGETRDAWSSLFPGAQTDPGVPPGSDVEETSSGDAGLRLDLWDGLLAHVSLGGGVILDLPPGGYGRLRVKWAVPIPRVLLSRWAVTGFWRTDTLFGTTGALDFERPFGKALLARLSGGATLTERSPGVEWSAEAALLASLGKRSGAVLAGGPSGATEHATAVDRWRVYARLRSDVYRKWVFVEAEPEVAWPWTPERGRRATFALAFRLEIQFHGQEPEPPAPATPSVPPEDRPAAPEPLPEPGGAG